ncbi:MAG: hypothetical protein ACR2JC_06735 [Chloroflexota bacterium]
MRTPVTASSNLWQAIGAHHWLFVSNRMIWSTNNGGVSWTNRPLHLPAGLMLVELGLIDGRDGWATAQTHADSGVSASGTVLLHTMDGGVPWTETRLP